MKEEERKLFSFGFIRRVDGSYPSSRPPQAAREYACGFRSTAGAAVYAPISDGMLSVYEATGKSLSDVAIAYLRSRQVDGVQGEGEGEGEGEGDHSCGR